ncbi:ferritin-like domain-containing protein [Hymenobacter yonginensis]|uniref:Ferritin-like domain-containing protein n=1 Tax=Hymenobacter yonginensis TaxID=748197 RepID=A0ABY7PL17_9BACT|nr:ferritin-like domain-containing protein [Hymenobacter yonginensis]WBO83386.1 ferritin-like domain-containing protein [Hymenobacter yonginensis]
MHTPSSPARMLARRSFFRVAGAGAAASALVLAGCGKDDPEPTVAGTPTLTLGSFVTTTSSDPNITVLNYAYLLEQIEAAFYDKVVATPPADLQPGELAYLTDLRDHELIHREYLKYALGTSAYDNSLSAPLVFNFSTFTLTTRTGVWTAARQLEEIGVAAYNGAAKYLTSAEHLNALGKIVSVEARHAALAREVLQPGSFADNVGTTGLDDAKTPAQIVALIQPFVPVVISTANLPTT